MPAKHTLRSFEEGGYYHIYNRGVEKRRVFLDRQDYGRFIDILRTYLTPIDVLYREKLILRTHLIKNNLAEEIETVAFCLMPNHFHLLLKQKNKNSITRLMRQIIVSYTMYFNKRYGRVGNLFQGKYKASRINSDEYLLHLTRYIHLNPKERGAALGEFEWSSYLDYLGNRTLDWVNPKPVLDYFSKINPQYDYRKFVESNDTNSQNFQIPASIIIEED